MSNHVIKFLTCLTPNPTGKASIFVCVCRPTPTSVLHHLHHFTSSPPSFKPYLHSSMFWRFRALTALFQTKNARPRDRQLGAVLLSYRQHPCCLIDSGSATKEEGRSTASWLWRCAPHPLHSTYGAARSRSTSFRRHMLRCRHRCDWYDDWF